MLLASLLGVLMGLVMGLTGAGGGILGVPALVLGLGLEHDPGGAGVVAGGGQRRRPSAPLTACAMAWCVTAPRC